MTKKQKHNPNSRFNDFNAEDDFIVDLDINSNQQELPPVPLNNTWDDDATINTLLMGTDLNAQEEVDDDDLVLLDHRPIEDIEVLDEHENVDHFAIGPIEEFEDLVEETVPVERKAPITLNKEIIEKYAPDYGERMFYISGPRSMILAFQKSLKDAGIHKSHIKTDFFPGFA